VNALAGRGGRRLPALAAILALAGCAGPRLEVATAPSEPSITLSDAGIHLTILPDTWWGYPHDLSRHYTPVEVRIQNDRPEEILIRYGDFLAVDELRNQYRAVPPGEVARALFGGRRPRGDPAGRSAGAVADHPPLLAWSGPWWPYRYGPYRPWYPYSAYPYYGPFYPDPFYYDSPSWQSRSSGYDILTLGLREGRVLPGARVQGFLYFQQATGKGSLLTLTWTPASSGGKPVVTLGSQFRIIR
jgi:hypothetical protein